MVPYQLDFLEFLRVKLHRSHSTLVAYQEGLEVWGKWAVRSLGLDDPTKITADHIKKFRDYMQSAGYAYKTVELRFNALSMYFKFLVDMEILKASPIPDRIAKYGRAMGLPQPPTPMEIFRMRQKPGVKLETAMAFETILSMGCRVEDFLQSRVFEFNFQDRPFDKELQRPSPYFAGSLILHPATHRVKNNTPRKVYFSELAGRLIKAYCAREGYPLDANLTLLPYSEQLLYFYFDKLREGVISRHPSGILSSGKSTETVSRLPGYSDIDLSKTPMSPRIRKLMENRKRGEEAIPDHLRSHKEVANQHRRTLKPHILRHAFTNFCYYRNPMGERNDDHHLRMLLGHNDSTSTTIYLRGLDMIPDDTTWKRLWVGVPEDWMDAFLE